MRIIAGDLKGARLETKDVPNLRPTTDRVREAVFSMLYSLFNIEQARVLDLFAGSGALGFEALSRGASEAVFVEKDSELVRLIGKNANRLKVESRIKILNMDVDKFFKKTVSLDLGAFNVVFADPPYLEIPTQELLCSLLDSGVCNRGSFFVLESSSRDPKGRALSEKFEIQGQHLSAFRQKARDYGDTRIEIFSFVRRE